MLVRHIRFIDPFVRLNTICLIIHCTTVGECNSSTNTLIKAYSFESKKEGVKERRRKGVRVCVCERERGKERANGKEKEITSLASGTLFKRYFVRRGSIKFLVVSTEAGFNPTR